MVPIIRQVVLVLLLLTTLYTTGVAQEQDGSGLGTGQDLELTQGTELEFIQGAEIDPALVPLDNCGLPPEPEVRGPCYCPCNCVNGEIVCAPCALCVDELLNYPEFDVESGRVVE